MDSLTEYRTEDKARWLRNATVPKSLVGEWGFCNGEMIWGGVYGKEWCWGSFAEVDVVVVEGD